MAVGPDVMFDGVATAVDVTADVIELIAVLWDVGTVEHVVDSCTKTKQGYVMVMRQSISPLR